MRNDNKSWKTKGFSKGGRTGKQFGGPLAQPGVAQPGVAQPLARPGVAQPLARPGVAPVRPLGFKGGARVGKVHGRTVRPLTRPVVLKGGKTAKAGGGYIYKKK